MKAWQEKVAGRVINATGPAQEQANDDISHVVCRKKGNVTVQFCAMCTDFEAPVTDICDADILEGMDGIDPHTGNSYATCKYFGEIVRFDPFYAQVRREQIRAGLL